MEKKLIYNVCSLFIHGLTYGTVTRGEMRVSRRSDITLITRGGAPAPFTSVPQPSTLPLYQYQLRSFDFVINRLFMKLFRTSDIQVVARCHEEFCFDLPSVQLARRRKKCLDKLYHCHIV